jgi:predicted transcriptional regulator
VNFVIRKGRRIEVETIETAATLQTAQKRQTKGKNFAYVPLPWGYKAMRIAGRGAAIVLHALRMQETTKRGDVPITAKFLKQCGLNRKTRGHTIDQLVGAGLATARRRGKKSQGCPLLTLIYPKQ